MKDLLHKEILVFIIQNRENLTSQKLWFKIRTSIDWYSKIEDKANGFYRHIYL